MNYLIFKEEQFSNGGFSSNFKSVKDALVHSEIIMSPQDSNDFYWSIYIAGVKSALTSIEKKDDSLILKGFKLIEEGL